jgi:hypothetical protein
MLLLEGGRQGSVPSVVRRGVNGRQRGVHRDAICGGGHGGDGERGAGRGSTHAGRGMVAPVSVRRFGAATSVVAARRRRRPDGAQHGRCSKKVKRLEGWDRGARGEARRRTRDARLCPMPPTPPACPSSAPKVDTAAPPRPAQHTNAQPHSDTHTQIYMYTHKSRVGSDHPGGGQTRGGSDRAHEVRQGHTSLSQSRGRERTGADRSSPRPRACTRFALDGLADVQRDGGGDGSSSSNGGNLLQLHARGWAHSERVAGRNWDAHATPAP